MMTNNSFDSELKQRLDGFLPAPEWDWVGATMVTPDNWRERATRLEAMAEVPKIVPGVLMLNALCSPEFVTPNDNYQVLAELVHRFGPDPLSEVLPEALVQIVKRGMDISHRVLLQLVGGQAAYLAVLEHLETFLATKQPDDSRWLLKQARGCLILAELYEHLASFPGGPPLAHPVGNWHWADNYHTPTIAELKSQLKPGQPNTELYHQIAQALYTIVNQLEVADFHDSKQHLIRAEAQPTAGRCSMPRALFDKKICSRSGLRFAPSSANASDNWTCIKERGGVAINFAINLSLTDTQSPTPPVLVTAQRTATPALQMTTVSNLVTTRIKSCVIDASNAVELFCCPNHDQPCVETAFTDFQDPLIFIKYALVYTGIVGYFNDPESYLACPDKVIEDIKKFTDGGGLEITIDSRQAPSRAGFASSSAVATNLLNVLYQLSDQPQNTRFPALNDNALVFENDLGLKSGKQDTDGVEAGLKSIVYPPTSEFPVSQVKRLDVDEAKFNQHIVLFDTGIQREAKRGLNARHHVYLSRDPDRFPAILESYHLHAKIIEALQAGDYQRYGLLSCEYLQLRIQIDPHAITPVLAWMFESFTKQGLICGGKLAGAMGGGVAELVLSHPEARPKLLAELQALKTWTDSDGQQPFARSKVYHFSINTNGVESWIE